MIKELSGRMRVGQAKGAEMLEGKGYEDVLMLSFFVHI